MVSQNLPLQIFTILNHTNSMQRYDPQYRPSHPSYPTEQQPIHIDRMGVGFTFHPFISRTNECLRSASTMASRKLQDLTPRSPRMAVVWRINIRIDQFSSLGDDLEVAMAEEWDLGLRSRLESIR